MRKKWDIDNLQSARIANLTTLIAALEGNKLSASDMGAVLGLTKSGAARYINDMLSANLIYRSGHATVTRTRCPLYSLNRDKRIVQAFVERIVGVTDERQAEKNRITAAKFQKQPQPVKAPPHTDLMMAFFGMNRSAA